MSTTDILHEPLTIELMAFLGDRTRQGQGCLERDALTGARNHWREALGAYQLWARVFQTQLRILDDQDRERLYEHMTRDINGLHQAIEQVAL